MSDHYRELATNLVPIQISDEIIEISDGIDAQIAIFAATSEPLRHVLAVCPESAEAAKLGGLFEMTSPDRPHIAVVSDTLGL